MPEIHLILGPRAPTLYWFVDQPGTNLVQVQQDWFARNWRKIPKGAEYPRYTYIREAFEQDAGHLERFLAEETLGTVKPTQCEVTYVNALQPVKGIWEDHADISAIIRPWSSTSVGDLVKPEEAQFNVSYVLMQAQEPIGRLRITLQPAFSLEDQVPIYLLNLSTRGNPLGEGFDGVMNFFDLGHETIVRAFEKITSDELHVVWGKNESQSNAI